MREHIEVLCEDTIATLVLDRPDCGNALSIALMKEIIGALRTFKDNTDVRVILIRGEGKHFCVGADLKDTERQLQLEQADLLKRQRSTSLGRELIQAILEVDQITIAAIQGAAAGGGACIASACDFRIGTDTCQIGYPEVKLGMNLSWGALPLCYNLIGPAKTRRMVIGGELESAQDLERWGFLDEVTTDRKLLDAAGKMAEHYAICPPLAAQMVKRGINALQLSALNEVMHMDGDQFVLATLSDEFKEARKNFLNRMKNSSN